MFGLSAMAAVTVAVILPSVVFSAVMVPSGETERMLWSLLVHTRSGAVSVFLNVGLKLWLWPLISVRLEVPRETVMFFLGGV